MKSKLQKRDIFIPLSGGAETFNDPRVPNSPTVTCENVRFSSNGAAERRHPLSELRTGLASNLYVAPSKSQGGTSVLVFGDYAGEIVSDSWLIPLVNSSENALGGWNGVSTVFDISETYVRDVGSPSSLDYIGDTDAVTVRRLYGESVYISGGTLSSDVYATGANSGIGYSTAGLSAGAIIVNMDPAVAATNSGIALAINTNATHTLTYSANFNHASTSNAWTSANAAFTNGGANTIDSVFWTGDIVSSIMVKADTETAVVSACNYKSAAQTGSVSVNFNPQVITSGCMCQVNATHVVSFFGSDGVVSAILTNHDATGGVTNVNIGSCAVVTASATNGFIYLGACVTEAGQGILVATAANSTSDPPFTVTSYWDTNATTVRIRKHNSTGEMHNDVCVAGPFVVDSKTYAVFAHSGSNYWIAAPLPRDRASQQNFLYLARFCPTLSEALTGKIDKRVWLPVAIFGDHPTGRLFLNTTRRQRRLYAQDDGSFSLGCALSSFGEKQIQTNASNAISNGYGQSCIKIFNIDKSYQNIVPREFGGYLMIPGAFPLAYDGSSFGPMGAPEYPEGVVPTIGTGAGEGVFESVGTYGYCVTFRSVDNLGNETVSAPSPPVSISVPYTTNQITITYQRPTLFRSIEGSRGKSCYIDIYRTSADGTDYFKIGQQQPTTAQDGVGTFLDKGALRVTSSSALDVILSAKPLYTINGELENEMAKPHLVGCVHSGRYFYAPRVNEKNLICYSKSQRQGIAPEFNSLLSIECTPIGGAIRSLSSYAEKLYIFKEGAILVTYGEPLNDSGAGNGFAPPRLISDSAGVAYATSAASGPMGIVFINSIDGLVYLLDGSDNISPIGDPVRHYCKTYAYDNVYFSPQDNSVRITSITAGAPVLSFDYKHNKWSTFTGRYAGGVRSAFSANVGWISAFGQGGHLDVVTTANGVVHMQSTNPAVGFNENYNVNISTSWISLGDIGGYGKFYKWTLIGGKKKASLGLNLKTAYDMEPYWTDNQVYDANALTNFSISDQYGTMNSSTVVDQALKIIVDGSRHKTDAVRLCVSTTNGLGRDDVEIVGARLEIGVREGSTKLGSGRTVQ